jgi:hypothetical protein
VKRSFLLVLFSLVILILVQNNIFADDIGILDIITYDVIEVDSNFDVNVVVVNNSPNPRDINLNVNILFPTGLNVGSVLLEETIIKNSTQIVSVPFIWGVDIDTNESINSHIINVELINDYPEGSIKNNHLRKYFVIKAEDRKIPVPDFPIVLSILLVFSIVLLYSKPKLKTKKIKKI